MTAQAWMARTDACPECVTTTETPIAVQPAAGLPGGYLATYICSHCGHDWTTTWADIDWTGLFTQ